MKKLALFALFFIVVFGCDKSPTHEIGKTIELQPQESVTQQAVADLVRSLDFQKTFIQDMLEKELAKNVKPSNVSFKIWMSNDDKVMLDFSLPGYDDSDLDRIAKCLKNLVKERLSAQQPRADDTDTQGR